MFKHNGCKSKKHKNLFSKKISETATIYVITATFIQEHCKC